ncbi:NAD(P)-dependent oxidoreductase [Paenibacillus filicis]|uniref:NAD(P)-dependent oxidoreductase n=2 Tax=Paenibacillus gyeongsangnamensis TaxID=3388067 RepID=A0ABT4QKS7_9BACL|nr:NAD(P)-dependent oxidoreductase [Paenibacillus filicis]MCZ8517466.1 NAD(P)-dependent oxidoreductase [Paenibacillus filicis]
MEGLVMQTVGWIGLGAMGNPMAANLLRAGYEVYVHNRTKERAEPLLQAGAKWAQSPREVCELSDVIVTMVADAAAIEQLLTMPDGILASELRGKTVVNMSTIGPGDTRKFAEMVHQHGGDFLDAPVSGSVKPAQEGQLVILVGGEADVVERCQPMFGVLGKSTIHFGDVGNGSAAKLVINSLLAMITQGISEALVMASGLGLNKDQVAALISESALNTPFFQMKKGMLLQEEFPPAFALKLMAKDLKLAADEAIRHNVPLPVVATVLNTYLAANANGKGDLDVASIYLQLKELAGLGNDEKR